MKTYLVTLLVGLTVLSAPSTFAQDFSPRGFTTDDGFCSFEQMELLEASQAYLGRTLTLGATVISKSLGLNPEQTGNVIPPLTNLACHFEFRGSILVSSSDPSTPYCGWIRPDNLLKIHTRSDESELLDDSGVCGTLNPMSVKDFCQRMKDLGQDQAECDDPTISDATFDAKFIVDNTSLTGKPEGSKVSPVIVNAYRNINGDEKAGEVEIFSVLQLYDVDLGDSGLRFLVQVDEENPVGWLDAGSGNVWYSKLTTFFAPGSTESVLSDLPNDPDTREIAGAPSNLVDLLYEGPEFQRYPVLQDNRNILNEPSGYKPNLRIAFIGAFCGNNANALCSEVDNSLPPTNFSVLTQTDVIFLIDGTKSMRTYYGLVARAVENVAKDYVGNPLFQFGVAMYGDFENPGRTSADDPMQFRYPIPLSGLLFGDEFEGLAETDLYIADALEDKPEAAYAALERIVKTANWRGDVPKWIIHIADHGDRVTPGVDLISAMREKSIFYAPIAVRGEGVSDFSKDFVKQSAVINEQYTLPSGTKMSLPVNVTYAVDGESQLNEYEAISKALNGALAFGEELRRALVDEIYSREPTQPTPVETLSSQLPAGFAELKDAGLQIYFPNLDALVDDTDITKRTVAAIGHVETAPLGSPEQNWKYFAALAPGDLGDLTNTFENACTSMGEPDSLGDVTDAVQGILTVLTGDQVTEEELRTYFADRSKIPLSTQTIINGDAIFQIMRDIQNPLKQERVSQYQREFCRTAELLGLMQSSARLDRPYETRNSQEGDLIWEERQGTYTFRNSRTYDWTFIDDFGRRSVFLPLEFLPSYPEE